MLLTVYLVTLYPLTMRDDYLNLSIWRLLSLFSQKNKWTTLLKDGQIRGLAVRISVLTVKRFRHGPSVICKSVTRWTKQAFPCSKFLSTGGQLWASTAFEGSQFHSIGVLKFYS